MGIDNITYIITILSVILVSMTLHEVMHGFVAYYLGDDTAKLQGRLTLNPIKHIDPFLTILLPVVLAITGAPVFGGAKPVPFNPNRVRYGEWGAALVAFSGPLTNLFIAFITFGIYVVMSKNGSSISPIFYIATLVNLGFFIFNMIPIPPLDGSRVLYAFAPDGIRTAMDAIERMGLAVIFVLVFFASSLIGSVLFSATELFIKIFADIYGIS